MGSPKGTPNVKKEISMKHVKKLSVAIMVLALFMVGFGCTKSDADRVAAKIATVHDTIKAVITDVSVVSQIPKDTMEKLSDLEDKYQTARTKYLASKSSESGSDWSLLKEMVSYGSGLISIIKTLPQVNQYAAEIAVAQATIEALVKLFG